LGVVDVVFDRNDCGKRLMTTVVEETHFILVMTDAVSGRQVVKLIDQLD
jgi:hypothetical protein